MNTATGLEQVRSHDATRPSSLWVKGLVLGIGLVVLLTALDTYPHIWFDEGYKANAGYTLATYGVYGTFTANGFVPFDPGISSGPADLVMLALSFKLFGVGIAQARLVSVLFTLIAIFSLLQIAEYSYGQRAAVFIVLFVLAFPAPGDTGFLLVGRQILGEPAALGLIALGIWLWFKSWQRGSAQWSVLSGLAIGLGLLSKTQIAISLVPALGIIGLARGLQQRSGWLRELLPVMSAAGVVVAWMLVGRILTPADIAAENSRLLMEAIRTNLITDLWGRGLTRTSLVILGIMVLSTLVFVRQWYVQRRLPRSQAEWAEAAITLFIVLSIIWFGLFSVGWPRYAYAALVFALLLIGKLGWDIVNHLFPKLYPVYPAVITALILAVLAANFLPLVQSKRLTDASQVGDYIRGNIPPDATVETWEWELDALSGHPRIHHPEQDYLFLAIRQFSHENRPFDLGYNLLKADPDYLITGPFSHWTHIYDQTDLDQYFVPVARIGRYKIYQSTQREADQPSK